MAARPPWKKSNPRKKAHRASTKLSPSKKAAAKRSAKRAGRPYPNLVDNMRVAGKTKASGKKTTKKKATKKKTAKTKSVRKKTVRKA